MGNPKYFDKYTREEVPEEEVSNYEVEQRSVDPYQVTLTHPVTRETRDYDPSIHGESQYEEYEEYEEYEAPVSRAGKPLYSSRVEDKPIRIDDETGKEIPESELDQYELVEENTSPVKRIDDTTGEEITDFDPSEWEPVEETGFWGKTADRLLSRKYAIEQSYYGIGEYLGKEFPSLGIDPVGQKVLGDAAGQVSQYINNDRHYDGNYLLDSTSKALTMAPEVAGGAAAAYFGAIPAAIGLGGKELLTSFGRSYNETGDAGLSAKRGTVDAAADLPFALIPGMKGMKGVASPLVNYGVKAAKGFGLMSGANAISEFYRSYSGDMANEPDVARPDTFANTIVDGIKQTPFAGAGYLLDSYLNKPETLKKQIEAVGTGIKSAANNFVETAGETGIISAVLPMAGRSQTKSAEPDSSIQVNKLGTEVDLGPVDFSKLGSETDLVRPQEAVAPDGPIVPEIKTQAETQLAQEVQLPQSNVQRITGKYQSEGTLPVLEAIERNGRIKGRSGRAGGEFDGQLGVAELGGYASKVFGGDLDIDQMHQILIEENALSRNSTTDDVWMAIEQEIVADRIARAEFNQEKRFVNDLLSPRRDARVSPTQASDLVVGQKVRIKGRSLRVSEINPDTMDVTLEGGEAYGRKTLSSTDILYPDKIEDIVIDNSDFFENWDDASIVSQRQNLDDPVKAQALEYGVRNLQEVRPAIRDHVKLDIETTAADFIRDNTMDINQAIKLGDNVNQYRQQLERKLSQAEPREINAVRAELERLDYPSLDLDLVGRLQRVERPSLDIFYQRQDMFKQELIPDMARNDDAKLEVDARRFTPWGDESGAVNLEPVENVFKNIRRNTQSLSEIAAKEGFSVRKLPDGEAFAKGYVDEKYYPGVSEALSFVRQKVGRFPSLAQQHAPMGKAWEVTETSLDKANVLQYNAMESVMPALQVADVPSFNKLLLHIQEASLESHKKGKTYQVTDESLRAAKVPEDQIAGYKALVNTNKAFFGLQRDAEKVRATDTSKLFLDKKIREINDSGKLPEDKMLEIQKATKDAGAALEKRKQYLDDLFEAKELSGYLPAMRNGSYFVKGIDPATGRDHFYMTDSKAEAATIAQNFARDFKLKPEQVEIGELPKPIYSHEVGLDPLSILESRDLYQKLEIDGDELFFLDAKAATEGKKLSGLRAHLMERKGVAGYDENILQANIKYLTSMANNIPQIEAHGKQLAILEDMKLKKQNYFHKTTKEYWEELRRPRDGFDKVAEGVTHMQLGGLRMSAGLVDYLGTVTSTVPELFKYTARPEKAIIKSIDLMRLWNKDRATFVKNHPELAKDLDYAVRAGVVGSAQVAGLTGDVSQLNPTMAAKGVTKTGLDTAKDASMFFKKFADEQNRMIAFIASYDLAPKGISKARFAREFVANTQALYGKQNRPPIGRGKGRLFYHMKEYQHMYWSRIGNAFSELLTDQVALIKKQKNGKALTPDEVKQLKKEVMGDYRRAFAYPATLVLTGGVKALPGIKTAATIAAIVSGTKNLALTMYDGEEREDFDLERSMNKNMPKGIVGDLILLGGFGNVPQLWGGNPWVFGGQINPQARTIEGKKNLAQEVGEMALGPTSGVISSIGRGLNTYRDTGDLRFAIQEGSPSVGLKNYMRMADRLQTGEVRNTKGQVVIPDDTIGEAIGQGIGFPSARVANEQAKDSVKYDILGERKEATEGVYNRMAYRLRAGDQEGFEAEMRDLRKKGIKFNGKALKAAQKAMRDPKYRMEKGVPKDQRRRIRERQAEIDRYADDDSED
jgi:hypothetical protein